MSTQSFNPNAPASENSGIFGLPFSESESSLIFLPVPWEATTSYGGGTSKGPSAILNASRQVDLYDLDVLRPYEAGLYMLPESAELKKWNELAKDLAQKVMGEIGKLPPDPQLDTQLREVNRISSQVNQAVYQETRRLLSLNKLVGIVGGDHSVPLGAFKAVAEKVPSFGILHFDAHSDTRKAYEGFTYSHASIMYNALQEVPQISKLVQVGIRDVCEEEIEFIAFQKDRMSVFFDRDIQHQKMKGTPWDQLCSQIVSKLPNQIWISFDIDGLDPRFCPHTGTPVPGGLEFHEANYLISKLVRSGKKIIGFDLNEVAPNLENPDDEWDANVGARVLYKLSAWCLASQSKVQLRPNES